MNEETTVTLGASILSLAVGWAVRHFHLFNLSPVSPAAPAPTPSPAAPASPMEQRLDLIEKQLAALIVALSRPVPPASPAN